MPVCQGPDSLIALTSLFIRCSEPELFMSVSRPTGVQLVAFSCSSILVMLLIVALLGLFSYLFFFFFCFFDNPGIAKCLNTLVLLNPHLSFIIGFICDLSVGRNDSLMS